MLLLNYSVTDNPTKDSICYVLLPAMIYSKGYFMTDENLLKKEHGVRSQQFSEVKRTDSEYRYPALPLSGYKMLSR